MARIRVEAAVHSAVGELMCLPWQRVCALHGKADDLLGGTAENGIIHTCWFRLCPVFHWNIYSFLPPPLVFNSISQLREG